MEANIAARTGQRIYPGVIGNILKNGKKRTVRKRETLDIGFTTLLLETPYDALPLHTGRNLNPAIAAAEALQLIGAFTDPALMIRISPKFKQFLNGDGFHGAYGSRVRYQSLNVITKLREDAGTRQAIISLWDPVLDNIPNMRDYPCTIMLQFEVENERLCMNTIMRSNDAFLGLPYDMFQFTQLQLSLARSLRIEPGWYRHTALSMHLYVDDLAAAERIDGCDFTDEFQPQGVGHHGDNFTTTMKRARRIACHHDLEGPTLSEGWYQTILTPYAARTEEVNGATVVG